MSSGHENSPDNGAPLPFPHYIRLALLVFLAVVAFCVWRMWPAAADCRTVPAPEIEARDGKALLRLDKLNLKPGECVRIAP